MTEKFEDTAVGKFLLSARDFAAEIEYEKVKERTQRGRRARVDMGTSITGCKAPYDYRWADQGKRRLEEGAETAAVGRHILREIGSRPQPAHGGALAGGRGCPAAHAPPRPACHALTRHDCSLHRHQRAVHRR